MPAVDDDTTLGDTQPSASPAFRLLDGGRGIAIAGWTISATDGPIASSDAYERLGTELGIKLPSMLFDCTCLTARMGDFELRFDAAGALRGVGAADPDIKVKAAAKWSARPAAPDVEIGTVEDASDWTFSTKYQGTVSTSSENGNDSVVGMDNNALRDTSLPILFSTQLILFEDELDDNGTTSYRVRIRVMPGFFFILTRFFLRVDSVLVRIFETRYFHAFGSPVIIRDTVHKEASIPTDLQHLHVSVLRDADLLSPKVPKTFSSLENIPI